MTGKNLAHGANAKLVGKDLLGMKDPDGKLPVNRVLDLTKEKEKEKGEGKGKGKGKGWSGEMKFRNPTTEAPQCRIVYIERVGDTFFGTGVFLD